MACAKYWIFRQRAFEFTKPSNERPKWLVHSGDIYSILCNDAPISVSGLSLRDLYSFGFVFLGLYFILSSIGNFLYWLHYSFVIAAVRDFDPERKKSLYEISKPLVTVTAGFICIVFGKYWAEKLSDKAD